jgi:LITAF-like zinc ribbon protein
MQDPAYQPYQSQHQQPYAPVGFVCPFCRTTTPPQTYVKVSMAGWVIFVVLILSCFGILLAWIGLLMKEPYKVCRNCGIKLG